MQSAAFLPYACLDSLRQSRHLYVYNARNFLRLGLYNCADD